MSIIDGGAREAVEGLYGQDTRGPSPRRHAMVEIKINLRGKLLCWLLYAVYMVFFVVAIAGIGSLHHDCRAVRTMDTCEMIFRWEHASVILYILRLTCVDGSCATASCPSNTASPHQAPCCHERRPFLLSQEYVVHDHFRCGPRDRLPRRLPRAGMASRCRVPGPVRRAKEAEHVQVRGACSAATHQSPPPHPAVAMLVVANILLILMCMDFTDSTGSGLSKENAVMAGSVGSCIASFALVVAVCLYGKVAEK